MAKEKIFEEERPKHKKFDVKKLMVRIMAIFLVSFMILGTAGTLIFYFIFS